MKEDMTEDLLIRYILEEANPDERREVETWLQAGDDHAKRFEQTKFLLDNSKKLARNSPLSEQQAWDNFQLKRAAKPAQVKTLNGYGRWLQAVAAVLVVAIGAWMAYYYSYQRKTAAAWITFSTHDKVAIDTLPDGSIIHLNRNSSISYRTAFNSGRTVKLTGEAFFNVVHNDKMPFNVLIGDVSIRDIGTAFNVHNNAGRIEVIVESGSVRVSRLASSVDLKPAQMVHIKPGNMPLQVEKSNDLLYQYYRTNEFAADHTPLSRLVEVLNEAYGARIKIQGKDLAELPITIPLKKESLDKVLQVIMLTTPEIHRVNRGDEIILTR